MSVWICLKLPKPSSATGEDLLCSCAKDFHSTCGLAAVWSHGWTALSFWISLDLSCGVRNIWFLARRTMKYNEFCRWCWGHLRHVWQSRSICSRIYNPDDYLWLSISYSAYRTSIWSRGTDYVSLTNCVAVPVELFIFIFDVEKLSISIVQSWFSLRAAI